MKRFLIPALFGLLLTSASPVMSTPTPQAPLKGEVASIEMFDLAPELIASDGVYVAPAPEAFKVPIYSVSLPEENKIVLVKDPKGFIERAIRHKLEYIAIKPTLKDEFWELVPVFAVEKSLSFNPKTTIEHPSESELETLRIVPVADFIRYN